MAGTSIKKNAAKIMPQWKLRTRWQMAARYYSFEFALTAK